MNKGIFILFIALLAISCQKDKTISEELVGEWIYERETFNSFSTFEDPDTEGFMIFNEDESGNWDPQNGFFNYDIEWDLQLNDSKIAITKYLVDQQFFLTTTTVYDLTREDEDNFTFTYHIKFEAPVDSLESFVQFENIILTRVE